MNIVKAGRCKGCGIEESVSQPDRVPLELMEVLITMFLAALVESFPPTKMIRFPIKNVANPAFASGSEVDRVCQIPVVPSGYISAE